MSDFRRRFILNDPAFAQVYSPTTALTEQEYATSSLLVQMAQTIRGYSKLISTIKLSEVYATICNDTDFEIGLLLLAAKDDLGNPVFTLEQVEAMLYGVPALPRFSDFFNGLTEISCKFAAAKFVIAYAVLPYQEATAAQLRRQAEFALNFIIESAIKRAATSSAQTDGADSARFYFAPGQFTIGAQLKVSFYLPNLNSVADWITATVYPAQSVLDTRRIASDLAAKINSYTLDLTNKANVIAAVSESGANGYVYIDFALRSYETAYNADLISVRFEYESPGQDIPFDWGLQLSDLRPTNINSCILIVRNPREPRISTLSSTSTTNASLGYNVLYFRTAGTGVPAGDLTYRVSITEDLVRTATPASAAVPRYSQQALALNSSLQAIKSQTRLVAAIVRDDPISVATPMAAVELVCWSVVSPTTQLVLDILTVPTDIEIALGDRSGPKTSFANYPLTLVCRPIYERPFSSSTSTPNNNGGTFGNAGVSIAQLGQKINQSNYSINDRVRRISGFDYNQREH